MREGGENGGESITLMITDDEEPFTHGNAEYSKINNDYQIRHCG